MNKSISTPAAPRYFARLKKIAVYTAVLGGAYFLFDWYNAIPSCASGPVRESIEFSAWHALRAMDENVVPALPKMLKTEQIGHASARRERGCVATVRAGEELQSYAYIVSPRDGRKVKFEVTEAHHLLVAARFGNLDRDGDFGNKAEPIGRDNVQRALRAALDAPNLFTTGSSISQVEPLGACRAVGGGQRYACNVMLQLGNLPRNGARASFGILQAEFTFERTSGREGEQPQWHAAGDTYGRYLRAVHEARKTALPVKPAPASVSG
ncbi:hypothetical protein QPK31_08660 [Massilia sp. YIM B02769]|uniref:hypothetical protein n=1 Tax=Massilia sp. YIM B02769 TaxID=3050129 RepID=UPI0025B6796A|nr:hypothetical protein [Massilia sp. YIM B02769]MDN4058297.1 hypothetical protein [Massilia sp. YIM B02769]